MDGLEEPEPGFLDGLRVLFLLLVRLCVRLLQAVDEGLEVGLQLLQLALLLLDHRLPLRRAHGLELLDLLRLRRIAELQVGGAALRPQAISELLQSREVPAALVVLEVVGVPVLDRRVAPHAHLVAQRLAAGRAVHVRNQRGLVVLEGGDQLVPIGLHALAVASPGSKELHEDGLPRHRVVPGLLGELLGARSSHHGCRKSD